MWTEKRGEKILYVERFENPLTGKMIRVSCSFDKDTAANRKKAQDILFAKFQDKTKSYTLEKAQTLSQLCELYLTGTKGAIKPATYKRNKYACDSFKRLLGKDTLIERMTANYVKECLKSKNNGTYNERIKRFKILMRWGYTNDYVNDIAWLDKLRSLPNKEKKEKLQDKFLEKEELNLLLDNMDVTKWKLLCELCSTSGMRVGEAIALEKDDVDFKNKVIRVNKNYDYTTNHVVTPKTLKSNREIYMLPDLENVCTKIKFFITREQEMCGYQSSLFLPDLNGEHVHYYAFNKYLRETSERVLGRKITTHVLRHTHVALLAENGVQLDVISRRLGHESLQITEIYFHITKRLQNRDNAILDNVALL